MARAFPETVEITFDEDTTAMFRQLHAKIDAIAPLLDALITYVDEPTPQNHEVWRSAVAAYRGQT